MILGCGVDLIEVGRIERELARRAGDPFDDLFSPAELRWCSARPRPAEAYALGFAAKEACVKALGTGLVGRMGWKDIEISWHGRRHITPGVTSQAGSWPSVSLRGETAAVAAAIGVARVHLSMTLCRPPMTPPGDRARRRAKRPSRSEGAGPLDTNPGSTSKESGPSRVPAPAGCRTGTTAAAWVVLEGAAP